MFRKNYFFFVFLIAFFVFFKQPCFAEVYDLSDYSLSQCKLSKMCIDGYLQGPSDSTAICDSGSFAECSVGSDGYRSMYDMRDVCTCVKPLKDGLEVPDKKTEPTNMCGGCVLNRTTGEYKPTVDDCKAGMAGQCHDGRGNNAGDKCDCLVPGTIKNISADNFINLSEDAKYNPFCTDGKNISTALGCVPTEMKSFITWLLKWLFGVAGGIAFLLMSYGFILIATSGGDEKKVQGAKETITSAIVGLLVCIFALFILRLITVNILQIPGIF